MLGPLVSFIEGLLALAFLNVFPMRASVKLLAFFLFSFNLPVASAYLVYSAVFHFGDFAL